jgi:hypothetical protein
MVPGGVEMVLMVEYGPKALGDGRWAMGKPVHGFGFTVDGYNRRLQDAGFGVQALAKRKFKKTPRTWLRASRSRSNFKDRTDSTSLMFVSKTTLMISSICQDLFRKESPFLLPCGSNNFEPDNCHWYHLLGMNKSYHINLPNQQKRKTTGSGLHS